MRRRWQFSTAGSRRLLASSLVPFVTGSCSDGATQPTNLLDELPEWRAELDLRIGSVDDPEQALTFIRTLETGADGRIYTLHPMEQVIRVFGPDGAPLSVIGGRGDGPGEFQNVIGMGWVGDTLWALDAEGYRFNRFSADGDDFGSFAVPFTMGDDPRSPQPPRAGGLLFDGTVHGAPPAFARQVADGTLTHEILLLMGRDGSVTDTVASVPFGGNQWAISDPDNPRRPQAYTRQPFADGPLWAFSPHERSLLVVERPAPDAGPYATFRVSKLGFSGDTVFSREYRLPALRVTDSEVDSILDAQAESLANSPAFAVTPGRARELAEVSFYRPPFRAAVADMLPGKDGSIWLRLQAPRADHVRWLVLDTDGLTLGQVQLPSGLQLRAVDPPLLYGSEVDELDVPYIVRYRLEPAPSPGG